MNLLGSPFPATGVPLQHDKNLDPQLFLPLLIHNPSHDSGCLTMAAHPDLGSCNAAPDAPHTEHILRSSSSPQIIAQATASNIMLDETSISIEHITGQQMQDTHVEQPLIADDAHHDVVWQGLGQHVDVFEAWTNSDDG